MSELIKMDQEVFRSQLKELPRHKYTTEVFQLRDIPLVMRTRLGWHVAAALMERWFNGAAFAMPDDMKLGKGHYRPNALGAAYLEEGLVTMQWALGFARVQNAMSELTRRWDTKSGRMFLKSRILAQSLGKSDKPWKFGDLSRSSKILEETCQVNYIKFGHLSDPMDDFYGAMGEAQMNVAVEGTVVSSGSELKFIPEELGFYLRDAYDFNDSFDLLSQPLGFWGFEGVERTYQIRWDVETERKTVHEKPEDVKKYKYAVQNDDFREWRRKNNRGGDFMILSNVHRVKINHPQEIIL
ncbi:DUF6402 family protein [Delftia acidovorans]|uniref:DUF6402 family protein n=1 Tax=Delftia acidovorans TaxID=80866 RepID=UPI001EFC4F04|nr:DUF6402 family protein [Delftia acidovorans]MCG8990565.1 DUF6402 family protein [Delftia acidovorans]